MGFGCISSWPLPFRLLSFYSNPQFLALSKQKEYSIFDP